MSYYRRAFEPEVIDFLTQGTGQRLDKDEFADFLSENPEAGQMGFVTAVFENMREFKYESFSYETYKYANAEFPRLWGKNQHFTEEVYNLVKNHEYSTGNPLLRSTLQHFRDEMFMNENAVRTVRESGILGRFSRNTNGGYDWLKTVVDIKGEKFFSTTEDFAPFLSAGVVSTSDLIMTEEVEPELVAKLTKMNLSELDISLTYQAVRNLSRRYLRSGILSDRNGWASKSFIQDKRLHERFYNEYKVSFYDVLLERLKTLAPVGSKKTTHQQIVMEACGYFFSKGAGRFTRSALEFYKAYSQDPNVVRVYKAFICSLSSGSREELIEWLSVTTGQPASEYEDIPKDWLVRMAEVF